MCKKIYCGATNLLLIIIIFFTIFATGCENKKEPVNVDENLFNDKTYENASQSQSNRDLNYSFGFGPINAENPIKVADEGISFPMYIKNDGIGGNFGIIISIDGYIQKFNESFLTTLSVDSKEEKELEVFIKNDDLTMNKGRNHFIQIAIILEPNFIPDIYSENLQDRNFLMRGEISSTTPSQFNYNYDKTPIKNQLAKTVKIDFATRKKLSLSENSSPEIIYDNLQDDFITKEELYKNFKIYLTSDAKTTKKVYMMVNNKPLDFSYDIELNNGEIGVIDIENQVVNSLKTNDIFYFIALPIDENSIDDVVLKSKTKVIKNEASD